MSKPPDRTLQNVFWLILLIVAAISLIGFAVESKGQTAEPDSVELAFLYLQFDYRVLEARMEATVQSDSLKFSYLQSWYEQSLDNERDKRKRDLVLIGVSAVVAGLLLYAGSRAGN